ncbi:MAG: transporter [Xanthobacteraceae bacterium]|jgi:hypothetical protein
MRFAGWVTSIGLALSILGAQAAAADQCPSASSPIATDRPSVTDSSLVVPERSLQSENGVNFSEHNGGHAFDGSNSELRWGVAPCLELLVDLPDYVAAVDGPLNSGFTDVTPAVKWQISPAPGQFDLSAMAGAGLPTGAKAIAGPGVQPYVQFPWSYDLGGGWGVSGMLTNFLEPANPANKLTTQTTFVLQRAVTAKAFVFVEYVGDYNVHAGPSYLLNYGAGYQLTPTQQIDFHLGIGLNDNAPAYVVGVGYSFRLDRLF